jgi:hypothetical protein
LRFQRAHADDDVTIRALVPTQRLDMQVIAELRDTLAEYASLQTSRRRRQRAAPFLSERRIGWSSGGILWRPGSSGAASRLSYPQNQACFRRSGPGIVLAIYRGMTTTRRDEAPVAQDR